jgi:hypothetical protein
VGEFKAKYGVADEQDETVVATLHLMATHGLDLQTAQQGTSRGGNDHGIDAWHYDAEAASLTLYQSKLTTKKTTALEGFAGLTKACGWLADLLRNAELDVPATNSGIFNLARCLADTHQSIRNVACVLISLFDPNELDDAEDFDFARTDIAKSALYGLLKERGGSLHVRAEQYVLPGDSVVPPASYTVAVREETSVNVGRSVLHVVFVSLYSLVELFRSRGELLFEKNIRFYLNTPGAKTRVGHPLEETLGEICSGSLDPNIFPFYHVGVTLAADGCAKVDGNLSLDAPYIINGCQTVNIAATYFANLVKEKASEKIERFKSIQVIAKVVTRAADAQRREIAICNNRQNPIEPWQLFSNDPIHVEIEASLKDVGVFYERQKGRFMAEKINTKLSQLQTYRNTNGTYVTVEDLGQVICLCRRQLLLAAKRGDIFKDKKQHDSVFTEDILERPHDMIWAFNAHKAVSCALNKYLSRPTLDNDRTYQIFQKQNVRQTMHYIAMMDLYQRKRAVSTWFVCSLNKRAAPTLVDEAEACYRSVVKKTRDFYLAESKNLEFDVSLRKMEDFLGTLCTQIGLDSDGAMPFTERAAKWDTEQREEEA